jgi:hypothetical protein
MPSECKGKNSKFEDIKNEQNANRPTKSLNPVLETEK